MSQALGKMNLRPFERRLLVGVLVVLVLIFNFVFIWPHFWDWGKTRARLYKAQDNLERYEQEIGRKSEYETKNKELEEEGAAVAADDQANLFFRTVMNQASISGVSLPATTRQSSSTNEFFLEQLQTFRFQAGEEELVDFLYSLGEGDSLIRARGLSLRCNASRQQLEGSIDLVASYQKKVKPGARAITSTTKPSAPPQPSTAK